MRVDLTDTAATQGAARADGLVIEIGDRAIYVYSRERQRKIAQNGCNLWLVFGSNIKMEVNYYGY